MEKSPMLDLSASGGVRSLTPWLVVGTVSGGGGGAVGTTGAPIRFVMERMDNSSHGSAKQRQQFWSTFVANDYKYQSLYRQRYAAGVVPNKPGFLRMQDRDMGYVAGLVSFETSLTYVEDSQLWIAFVTPIPIHNERDLVTKVTVDDIEMAVPVMTDDAAPMTTHLGIQRSFAHMYRALTDKSISLHGSLAMPLHSFAAKVILFLRPDKLYMISVPVVVMRDIFVKALRLGETVFVGDSRDLAKAAFNASAHPELQKLKADVERQERTLKRAEKALDNAIGTNQSADAVAHRRHIFERDTQELDEREALYQVEYEKEMAVAKASVVLTPHTTPIRVKQVGVDEKESKLYETTILDKTRTAVVFDRNELTGVVTSLGRVFQPPNDTKRFAWFEHRDLSLVHIGSQAFKYVIANLDALAALVPLDPLDLLPQTGTAAALSYHRGSVESGRRRHSRFWSYYSS